MIAVVIFFSAGVPVADYRSRRVFRTHEACVAFIKSEPEILAEMAASLWVQIGARVTWRGRCLLAGVPA